LKIGGGKDKQSAMDEDKKRKTVTPIWRPVCTQAISSEGYLHVPSKYHLAAGMIDPKNLSGSFLFFFFFFVVFIFVYITSSEKRSSTAFDLIIQRFPGGGVYLCHHILINLWIF
jgi:hypothetical protein